MIFGSMLLEAMDSELYTKNILMKLTGYNDDKGEL